MAALNASSRSSTAPHLSKTLPLILTAGGAGGDCSGKDGAGGDCSGKSGGAGEECSGMGGGGGGKGTVIGGRG
ncbi:MAG: bacteriocin microcin [Oscillospiraceae bacterium]|nr:bacteriocin microcin [Oscillospiraceae bacterium]